MVIEKSYVFIAFGMGITPFRSMIRDLIDKKQRTDIVLLYQARSKDELLFTDLFEEAEGVIGLRTKYFFQEKGKITKETIEQEVPAYRTKVYYVSGPQAVVEECRTMLSELGVSFDDIMTDLFTGYDEEKG